LPEDFFAMELPFGCGGDNFLKDSSLGLLLPKRPKVDLEVFFVV